MRVVGIIFAVVDTYDALRCERPYKTAMEHEAVLLIMNGAAGTRLDPALVQAFAEEAEAAWLRLAEAARTQGTFAGAISACAAEPSR